MVHSSRVQAIKLEEVWRELEAAGHVASAVGEQREEDAAQLTFLFLFQSWTLTHGMEKSKFRVNLPTSVNSIFKTHSHGQ